MRHKYTFPVLLLLVLSLGLLVRVIQFPRNPPGFNQDEAASAYEAYALAETGCDKWGNPLPAYFPAWGSGQNVLLAYLTVPAIKALGLSVLSARLPALVLGVLTLPLFLFGLWPLGRWVALLGVFLLAVAPWHFMLSRWALESNLAPFFMLLGCVALSRALSTQRRRWIVPCLLPFGLALYAYGTTVVVLPALLGAVAVLYRRQLWAQWPAWAVATALLLLLAAPFLIFFIENYLAHRNFAWTDSLFFSTPLLPATRMSQVSAGWGSTLAHNLTLLAAHFDDGTVYNVLPRFKPLPSLVLALAALGLGIGARRVRQHAGHRLASPRAKVLAVFALWLLASGALFIAFELNVNRFNHFFLPAVALAAWALPTVTRRLAPVVQPRLVWAAALGWLALESGLAIRNYFTAYRHGPIREEFNAGLDQAFEAAGRLPGVTQVRITEKMPLPYVYALFYLRYPPARFQREAEVRLEEGSYKVQRFGKYVFFDENLDHQRPYGYLLRRGELSDSCQPGHRVVFRNEAWEVGVVAASAPAPAN